MKHFFVLTALSLSVLLSSCSSIKPDGAMKGIAEGDIFTQEVRDPGPVDNHLPETEPKPPMRWKIEI